MVKNVISILKAELTQQSKYTCKQVRVFVGGKKNSILEIRLSYLEKAN